jgi:phosphoribosylformylglycinamidine synthase subunit PurQ / glutaminase
MNSVKTAILTGYGINADRELAEAFGRAGAEVSFLHLNDVMSGPEVLKKYHIIGFPGGFSFADHLGSGLVLAGRCKKYLRKELEQFVKEGKLIIGICNGFQVLVKMGILPNLSGSWSREVSLIHNDSGKFEDSWVKVSFDRENRSVWTRDLPDMELPIRHGEGRFITGSDTMLETLVTSHCIAVTYKERNPNGSTADIAGITDRTGRILGLMPHPEAFLCRENHPRWTRFETAGQTKTKQTGIAIFKNGVAYISEKLI